MARSPITPLVVQFQNLTQDEQKIFLDLVDPQPELEAPAKQTRKKRATRSPRAQSLSTAITSSRAAKPESDETINKLDFADEGDGPKCGACGHAEDYQDHFQPSPHYHQFEAPKAKKAATKT